MRVIPARSFVSRCALAAIHCAIAGVLVSTWAGPAQAAVTIDYDIVYVRQARFGDNTQTIWPEVFHPERIDPGADLMLRHPDGSEEVLVDTTNGAVTDPFISFDAEWCYYAFYPDVRQSASNYQRGYLPNLGSDIYRINLATRQTQRLTNQEFTPNTASGNWHPTNPLNPPSSYNRLGYGIFNLGPCPLAGGRVAFTSNRNAFQPTKGYTGPVQQIFVMDEDGENVELIAPMNIGGALHPTILADGRLMFSSYESQGLRDSRIWGLWAIEPDGRAWSPIVSAFHGAQAFHFMTQLGNGDLVVCDYYNLNNNGFGSLMKLPLATGAQPAFYNATMTGAPGIRDRPSSSYEYPFRFPFQPKGMHCITPFSTVQDSAAATMNGARVGKFTQPSGAPGNHLLVVWSPGPVNLLDRPTTIPALDAGLYVLPNGGIIESPAELTLIKNDPAYNEAWPRAVVPYKAVHGIAEPKKITYLPNDGTLHPSLPAGTPHALIGTSSFYKRESAPGIVTSYSNTFNGLDAFNTDENEQSSNWVTQGADAGKYTNSEIHAVRILAMEANTHRSYGPEEGHHYYNHANERLRILGEIPLRKLDGQGQPLLDPEGNPDTSFLAKIPADTPFTFQTINSDAVALNMAQTWHQVRPGEMRVNCGGCHAHSQQPLRFEDTLAGQQGFAFTDLTTGQAPLLTRNAQSETVVRQETARAVNVEFFRDIRPILQRSCVQCHNATTVDNGNLDLGDTATVPGTNGGPSVPGDYARLAMDDGARWGHKPVINNRTWRQTNASRYIRAFQSRRSLLIWKIMGRRLDGWTNANHPTETTPGDPATLPAGANRSAADLDYTGTAMPPPGSSVPPLTEDEKMLFARWVDLGCPINKGQMSSAAAGALGWFLDENRPTLTISSPRQNVNAGPLTFLRVGVADAYTGVAPGTLSIKADFAVNGMAAGAELAGLATETSPGVFTIALSQPIAELGSSHLTATVADVQGNVTKKVTRFRVLPDRIEVKAVDGAAVSNGRFLVKYLDARQEAVRRVRYSTALDTPAHTWPEARVISEAWNVSGECWAEVELPPGVTGKCFFVVERE